MTFSVAIATYTEARWDALVSAVDSALRQSPAPLEVIVVVDNNSRLYERVQQNLGERVVVVENSDRPGLSGARNTGAAVARGEHIAFLDDDARARPGWLEALGAALAQKDVVGAGGLTVPHWEAGSSPTWLPDEFLWVVGCHYLGHRMNPGPVRSPIGANMAFPRELIRSLGGFSWQFATPPFERCDETEFSLRAVNHTGGRIEFAPEAIVDHYVATSRNRWSYFVKRCMLEGRAKAALSVRAGVANATEVERRYVTRTLPAGVVRYVGRGFAGRPHEFLRAGNLIVGLALTGLGFLQGHLMIGSRHRQTLMRPPEWAGARSETRS